MTNHHRELDIHDLVNELTRTHTHREPYVVRRGEVSWTVGHVTTVPSLVLQLVGAAPASSLSESGSAPVSKPAARIEAIDTVMLIDEEAGEWIDQLGAVIPADRIDPDTQRPLPGSGTLRRLNLVHSLHAGLPQCDRPRGRRDEDGAWCCRRHHLEHDVRRWWHQARIITGWDSPAYRPFNTCPVCEQRGGLRINLVMQAGVCVECRSIWAADEIGLLAEHIRIENLEDEQADTPEVRAGA